MFKCNCTAMRRGTTPSLYYNMSVQTSVAAEYKIKKKKKDTIILEKSGDDVTIVDEDTIKILLSQEETMLFSAKYVIQTQVRAKYPNEATIASDIMEFWLGDLLKWEVL